MEAYAYLLRGIVFCAQCGSAHLAGTEQEGRPRYRHAQHHACTTKCRSVKMNDLDLAVVALIKRMRFAADIEAIISKMPFPWQTDPAVEHDAIELARRATLYRLNRRLTALEAEFEEGLIQRHTYIKRRNELQQQQIEASQPAVQSEDSVDMAEYLRNVQSPYALLQRAAPTERQSLMTLLFEGIW